MYMYIRRGGQKPKKREKKPPIELYNRIQESGYFECKCIINCIFFPPPRGEFGARGGEQNKKTKKKKDPAFLTTRISNNPPIHHTPPQGAVCYITVFELFRTERVSSDRVTSCVDFKRMNWSQ